MTDFFNPGCRSDTAGDAQRRPSLTEENPHPIIRIAIDGVVLCANPASRDLCEHLGAGAGVGASLDPTWIRAIRSALDAGDQAEITVEHKDREWRVSLIRPRGCEDINLYAIDVTDRREVQETLRQQRDLLGEILDSIPSHVFWKDRQSTYLGCNAQFAVVAGLPDSEAIIGKSDYDLPWTREESEGYRKCDQEVMLGGVPLRNLEETQRQADGTDAHVLTSKVPLRNGKGEVIGVLGVYADITPLKRAEQQVHVLMSALEAAANSVMLMDSQGTIVWTNAAFTALTGYAPEEAIGQSPRLLESGVHDQAFYQRVQSTITAGQVWRGEVINRRKDGRRYVEEVTITPVRSTGGEITHFVAVQQDVSERREAAARLQATLEENDRILGAINGVLIRLDANGCIRKCNEMAQSLLGCPSSETLGIPIWQTGIRWDWNRVQGALEECLRDGRAARISDMPFTDPGGRQRFHDLDLSPVRDRDAGLTGALLFALDVTERRVLLDQLLQAQKLESIGHLAAGIAHEINTPAQFVGDNMHFLQGAFDSLNQVLDRYVELAGGCRHVDSVAGMLREIEDLTRDLDLPFLRGEAVVAIRQSLDGLGRISAIVRAMKDFSRPNSAEKVHADLNRAIESTITVARNEWKYVADVVTDLSPDLPPIQCHIGQINQVVLNILVNGAHAITERTGDSGVLGRIDVTTRRDGAWVEIRVSDTGTGIPESARSKVFDHFFTTKAVGKGTGQGLAIAHTVIKQHGGTITFETETDKGTTFIVRLPINSEASTPVSTGAHSTV